jgi:signal transduction histidine kinase/CheY-like chemotaxis protein
LERLDEALGLLQVVVFGVLAVVALLVWRRRGGRAAARLAGTFGVLAAAVLVGNLLPEHTESPTLLWVQKLLIGAIILFPYLLYRFTLSFRDPGPWARRAAGWLTGVAVAGTLLLPEFPERGEPRPAGFGAYVALIVLLWLGLSAAAARTLWRAGTDESTVVRRRMRTLAVGALAMAAAVVISGLSPSTAEVTPLQIVVQLLALGSGPLFLLGFATPRLLRTAWRRKDESAFREAEIHLMQAGDATDIAQILLPAAVRLVGGRSSVLVDAEGRILGAHGIDLEAAKEVSSREATILQEGATDARTNRTLAVRLQYGTLFVELTRSSPFFGGDEVKMLRRVGALVDVALERARADREVRRLNDELRQRVNELEITNENLEEARAEAERANRAKSEFLSRMSHELRTPLNAILGFSQLLGMGALDSNERESVAHILKGGRHLLDLINEVLDISRIESGRLSLSLEEVDIGDVVAEVLDLVGPLATRQAIALDGTGALHGSTTALADRQRLMQVLLNLVANAVKYNRPGGTVRLVVAQSSEGKRRIEVIDTGPGIAPENLGRLFAPFERIGAEQSEIEGTGLGLALSKRLVEAMGGTIGVESRVGEGSTFWVELAPSQARPVRLDDVVNEQAVRLDEIGKEATQSVLGERGPGGTLLYVEDNLSNLTLIEQLLEQRPAIRLISALQGGLGLELARHHRPDLILLDLHLPDMHGAHVLETLRADPATHAIPVIILSADATPGQIGRLLDAGANDYLMKPLDLRRLLELLDEHLGLSTR